MTPDINFHRSGALTFILYKCLALWPEHRIRLRERGLSDEWINAAVYRSTPHTDAERDDVTEQVAPYLEAFGGGDVPGFYHDGRRWRMAFCAPGFFIPARDEYGRIQALAYRLDEPRDGAKYVWLSSNPEAEDDDGRQKYPRGASSRAPFHFANRAALWDAEELTITEGTLKADVIAALSGLPVAGVAGVNNTRGLAARLRTHLPNLRRIAVAFDKDALTKSQVAAALERLIAQLEGERFSVRVRTWPGEAKGLDDYLLSQLSAREVAT
jgi:alkylhydroperoxidase family enzyme